MHITLPPEIEAMAQQAAQAGGFADVASFVAEAIRQNALSDAKNGADVAAAQELSYQQWRERFDEFLRHRKPANPSFDDSRESMYFDQT